jgi:hypothetical protein
MGDGVLGAIESSNLPSHHKSSIRKWLDRATGGAGLGRAKAHALATGHVLRQGGEAVLVGGALGAIKAERAEGLDIKGKMPIDGIAGAAFLAASIGVANHEVSTDLRNAGSNALTVFAFRKSEQYFLNRKGMGAPPPAAAVPGPAAGGGAAPAAAGDYGEDPIVAAARAL